MIKITDKLRASISPIWLLWALEKQEQTEGVLYHAHLATQNRVRENALIAAGQASGDGVAVVWGGMDCDGVRYSGDTKIITITGPDRYVRFDQETGNEIDFKSLRQAVDHHIEHTLYWADGPCNYRLISVADATLIEYHSRDLGLEAFEDGHSHCLSEVRYECN